jgi:hypothetical protein
MLSPNQAAMGVGYVTVDDDGEIVGSRMEGENRVPTVIDLVYPENTIYFKKTDKDGEYSGNITGLGQIWKTGGDAKMVLSGTVDSTGLIKVARGTLELTGTLGVRKNPALETSPQVYTHEGNMQIDGANSTLLINTRQVVETPAADENTPAVLGTPTTIIAGTGIVPTGAGGLSHTEPAVDTYGALRGTPGSKFVIGSGSDTPVEGFATHVVLPDHYNTIQSDITVGSGSKLEITGHIGVVAETFDLNTVYATSYYHGRYAGTIDIKAGGVVDLATQSGGAYHADYQELSGNLVGTGTLVKSGPMPVYFTGDASQFAGKTEVTGGAFNLGENVVYGTTVSTNSFTVHAGSILGGAAGSALRTGSFVTNSGATIALTPGRFAIQTPAGSNATLNGVLNVSVALGANDVGAGAKLSFQDANGVTFADGNGVLMPGTLNLTVTSKDYFPKPLVEVDGKMVGDKFTLIEGLDFLPNIDAVAATRDQLNITNSELAWHNETYGWELEIMRSGFFAYYDNQGNLILEQYSHIHVPEPGTYALTGSALLLGLALFRRNRKKKLAKTSASSAKTGGQPKARRLPRRKLTGTSIAL